MILSAEVLCLWTFHTKRYYISPSLGMYMLTFSLVAVFFTLCASKLSRQRPEYWTQWTRIAVFMAIASAGLYCRLGFEIITHLIRAQSSGDTWDSGMLVRCLQTFLVALVLPLVAVFLSIRTATQCQQRVEAARTKPPALPRHKLSPDWYAVACTTMLFAGTALLWQACALISGNSPAHLVPLVWLVLALEGREPDVPNYIAETWMAPMALVSLGVFVLSMLAVFVTRKHRSPQEEMRTPSI